jgi:hypothetical protein
MSHSGFPRVDLDRVSALCSADPQTFIAASVERGIVGVHASEYDPEASQARHFDNFMSTAESD